MKQANGDVGAVRGMLADLARHEVDLNRERTSVFVRSVINFMGGSTNLMDNPDRGAAFVVLKTAKVPSILIELGYITNAEDAQQLKSDQWRDKVSGSIVTAVDSYFTQLPQVKRAPFDLGPTAQPNTSCRTPARTTSVPSTAMVVRMTGMSKWPAV